MTTGDDRATAWMTQRHFKTLAEVLADAYPYALPDSYADMNDYERGAYDEWNTIRLALTALCRHSNSAFDAGRFTETCRP